MNNPFSIRMANKVIKRILLLISLCGGIACERAEENQLWSLRTFNRQFWHGNCHGSNIEEYGDFLFFSGGYMWNDEVYLWKVNKTSGEVVWKKGPYSWIYNLNVGSDVLAYLREDKDSSNVFEVIDLNTGDLISSSKIAKTGKVSYLKPNQWLVQTKNKFFEEWNIFKDPKIQARFTGTMGYNSLLIENNITTTSYDAKIRYYSKDTKQLVFEKKIADQFTTELAYTSGVIAVGAKINNESFLIGFDAETGLKKWSQKLPALLSKHKGTIVADESRFYITGNYGFMGVGIMAINPRYGNIIWEQRAPVNGSITLWDKKVLLAAREELLYLDSVHGDVLMRTKLSDDVVTSPPKLGNKVAYVSTVDCKLRAIKLP